jgi:hypothetical protein
VSDEEIQEQFGFGQTEETKEDASEVSDGQLPAECELAKEVVS